MNADFYGIPQAVVGTQGLLCRLNAVEGATRTQFDFVRPTTESPETHAIVALTGLITLDAGGDVTVDCQSDFAGGFSLYGHSLVAINVGSATI